MKRKQLFRLSLTGLFAALIWITTAYLHIPSHTGYTHIGDAFLYLAACLLPLPYAACAGVIGAVLADCLTGFAVWAPASAVIKAVTALFFTSRSKRILAVRNRWAVLPSAAVCTVGYYLYEALITGNFLAPLAGIPGYLTQAVLSSVLFIALGLALDNANFKTHFINGGPNA